MLKALSQLRNSLLFSLAVLIAVVVWTYINGESTTEILAKLGLVISLALLEIAISFDNAVVNASVLKGMPPIWQKRFLTWGLIVAVFGMRLILPIGLVATLANLSFFGAFTLAMDNPDLYAETLKSAQLEIHAFGGVFLLLIALNHFIDAEKDHHWLSWIEKPLAKIGRLESTELGLIILLLLLLCRGLPHSESVRVLTAGLAGALTWVAVELINGLLNQGWIPFLSRAGLGGFIYLEVLDASFSFDGVVGALAITNQLVIITAGLSIGAIFVRSMTLMILEGNLLSQLKHLEAGAYWAIASLGSLLLLAVHVHTPEWLAGTLGALILGFAAASSLLDKKDSEP